MLFRSKRHIPGRIIGVSKDRLGNRALRMALQTREQHIKRERATSNICTAQVLLAVMAGMYAVYHGPKGIKSIAKKINDLANILNNNLKNIGLNPLNNQFFDTIHISADSNKVKKLAAENKLNFNYISNSEISISINEATELDDIKLIFEILSKVYNKNIEFDKTLNDNSSLLKFKRTSSFLTDKIFNTHHSETSMMRYIKSLERKDLSLNHSMISLGSCTMKLNAAAEMLPLSWKKWNNIHPFAPNNQVDGYTEILLKLEKQLNEITGFYATTLQPNSGAQGEYTGLMLIRAYFKSIKQENRNICLIPSSAHGTNPASAIMAGMKVVVVGTDKYGNINEEELKTKLEETLENMQNLVDASGSDVHNNDSSFNNINMQNIPNAEQLQSHLNSMLGGKLGKLALELAEETAKDLNLDMENDSNAKDVFQKLFKNPGKMMNMVKNIGGKLENKIKSGEISETEIMQEGMDMLDKMKNMPGMGDMKKEIGRAHV